MATSRGMGYADTYLMGRRQALEQSVKRAQGLIASDQTRFEAERETYQKSISALDKQILEYDKLLADARKAQSEVSQPRMGRVTRSSQRESPNYDRFARATSTNQQTYDSADALRDDATKPPEEFSKLIVQRTEDLAKKRVAGTLKSTELAAFTNEAKSQILAIPDVDKQAGAARQLVGFLVAGGLKQDQAVRSVFAGLDPKILEASTPEAIKAAEDAAFAKGGGEQAEEFLREMYPAALAAGAFTGGGGASSITRSEALPGEAARMAVIQSAGFKATAEAMRDDGVISDEERAQLAEANIDPTAYLDLDLMQAIARTGRLQSERSSLAGRRTAAQQDLASMIRPDSSMQREQELTSMFYGPGGVTPTQAFFQPKRVQEGITEEARKMSAKQAMLKGFVRAAKGDIPELGEDDNVYASQLTEAINSGNHEAVKQSFRTMTDAGFAPERVVSAFGVASRRARELDARRKAQAVQAAQPVTE